jgi:transcriptional regulator with XRE-family HTH domain
VRTIDQWTELGQFLSARRRKVAPTDVGLPVVGARRTPGLRREEVALLAGVGVSWYAWIEQGRAKNVSAEVLGAITRVLNLDNAQRQYVMRLAGYTDTYDASSPSPEPRELQPFVDGVSPNPAYIVDRAWNLVATNAAARELLALDGGHGNILANFFLHEPTRTRYPRWSEDSAVVVARFRAHAANYPRDPLVASTVEELRARSDHFAKLWDGREIQEDSCGVDLLEHPELGPVSLHRTTLDFTARLGMRLTMYVPIPGTGGDETVARLAALAAGSRRQVEGSFRSCAPSRSKTDSG